MLNNKVVLIGIQARSTSVRLPNKHVELIDGKRIIDHVLESCKSAADYLNRYAYKNGYETNVALLVPDGDPLADLYAGKFIVIQGSELDVLSRYTKAAAYFEADYIVRITGDCPLIPPFVISKHIVLALKNNYDYVSNVEERFRTTLDGIDCEVMSKRLLEWLDTEAQEAPEREHVTVRARTHKPDWARAGFVTSFFDLSRTKLSVDTPEDLRRVRDEYENIHRKQREAERTFGKDFVHRF